MVEKDSVSADKVIVIIKNIKNNKKVLTKTKNRCYNTRALIDLGN